MEHKACLADGLKMFDDGAGWIEGYGSTFGNVDHDNDIVVKGAFTESIPAFIRDGFMPVGHDWGALAVATIEQAAEDEHGLHLRAQFHSTPEAQAARTVVRERMDRGKSVGLSIGFRPAPGGTEFRDDGVRLIQKAHLYEVSIVTVPANALATVTALKSGQPFGGEAEAIEAAIAAFVTRTQARAEMRGKSGRVLSAANRERLAAFLAALRQGGSDIEALLAATDPAPPDDGKALEAALLEFLAIEARQRGVAV